MHGERHVHYEEFFLSIPTWAVQVLQTLSFVVDVAEGHSEVVIEILTVSLSEEKISTV